MDICSFTSKRTFKILAALTLIGLTPKPMLPRYYQKFVPLAQVEYVVMVDGKEVMASMDYMACLAFRVMRVRTDLRSCPARCKITFRDLMV